MTQALTQPISDPVLDKDKLRKEKDFIRALSQLDRASLANLRRSVAAETHRAYFLERHIFAANIGHYPSRLLYLVAGLYALVERPHNTETQEDQDARAETEGKSLATLLGNLSRIKNDTSTEKRFLALLDADEDGLPYHLRQTVMLLNGQNVKPDWARLLKDIGTWHHPEWGENVRQRWAKDFYRASTDTSQSQTDQAKPSKATNTQTSLFEGTEE